MSKLSIGILVVLTIVLIVFIALAIYYGTKPPGYLPGTTDVNGTQLEDTDARRTNRIIMTGCIIGAFISFILIINNIPSKDNSKDTSVVSVPNANTQPTQA